MLSSFKNDKEKTKKDRIKKYDLYSKKYKGWNSNLNEALEYQLEIAQSLFRKKALFCRTLIIIEICCFFAFVLFFIFI